MTVRFKTELRERFDPLGHLRSITGYGIMAMSGAVLMFANGTLPTYIVTATFAVLGATVLLREEDSEETVYGSVTVGADGVEIWERERPVFLSWSQVEHVQVDRRWFTIKTRSGAVVEFFLPEDADACADVIGGARYRFAQLKPVRSSPSCSKGDENARAWSARLRGARGDYRNEALTDEDLEATASSPAAPSGQRLGAVLALSDASEERRTRVRVAISQTANHELAAALEAAFEDELCDEMAERVGT